jgi:hypothetical protein
VQISANEQHETLADRAREAYKAKHTEAGNDQPEPGQSFQFKTMTFQPTLLGTELIFEHDEEEGMIEDEDECRVFIRSPIFTGWVSKALFYEYAGFE